MNKLNSLKIKHELEARSEEIMQNAAQRVNKQKREIK